MYSAFVQLNGLISSGETDTIQCLGQAVTEEYLPDLWVLFLVAAYSFPGHLHFYACIYASRERGIELQRETDLSTHAIPVLSHSGNVDIRQIYPE